ncbi:MAG: T9SS type A sorting domain-containing protein [Bacteroidales bacterium]|nr:T9SS type A sorting domain-containing protein [Bacteroidales bacterium]
MRKAVLFMSGVMLTWGLFAQSKVTQLSGPVKAQKVEKNIVKENVSVQSGQILQRSGVSLKNAKTTLVSKVVIGSSKNIYTALVSQSNVISANQDLNTITMTRRGNVSSPSSGLIQVSVSKDGGNTWDSTTVELWNRYTINPGRYPSGVIYNPAGNTNPDNAFVVGSGPVLNSSANSFVGNFFASVRLNGSNLNQQTTLYTTDTAGGVGYVNRFSRLYLQERKGKFFVLGDANTDNGTQYTSFVTVINRGIWDPTGDSVIWSRSYHVPNFLTSNGLPDGLAWPALIMDENGQNGYLIYIGRDGDATDNLSYIPMIYKTTDGGANWVKQTAFDWSAIPAVQEIANISRVGRPFFSRIKDATIDANGNPHFICYVQPAWSDHPDSLGYYGVFTYHNGFVFDFYKTSTGWNGFIIDTIRSKDVDEDHSPTSDPLDWDERIQVTRTPDGSVLFFAWMDTDTTLDAYNLYPDIIVKRYNVATNTLGPRVNLTQGTNYDGVNYWMYLGDYCFVDQQGIATLHITTSDLNLSDVGPVKHYYVKNVKIAPNGEYASIKESTSPIVSIYPNPVKDQLYVNLNSGNYQLYIYNTLGNLVLSKEANGGMNVVDMSKLPAGLYIINVTGSGSNVVKKVIKQ